MEQYWLGDVPKYQGNISKMGGTEMKTPEEWADLLISNQIAIIKEIQKDAYNQAIEDALMYGYTKELPNLKYDHNSGYWIIGNESILKLKK
jgi:hypothetical protein